MELHYDTYGDRSAPLMIFLHGGGVSSWMWDKQIKYFDTYYCVTVDLPQHGKSGHSEVFSVEIAAREVISLIEKLENGKEVVVIGFSLGAQVLVRMLGMRADLIDFAIINSALANPTVWRQRLIEPLVKMTFPLIRNRTFSKLQAKSLYIGEEYLEEYYNESSLMKRETLVDILNENMSFDIPEEFSEAHAKILVTVGAKEGRIVRKSALKFVDGNPNCTGLIFGGIGHGIMLADPVLFNQVIEKWLWSNSVQ